MHCVSTKMKQPNKYDKCKNIRVQELLVRIIFFENSIYSLYSQYFGEHNEAVTCSVEYYLPFNKLRMLMYNSLLVHQKR